MSNAMSFTDLVNAVITEVNRPDLGLVSAGGDGTIPQAVSSSTLKMHGMDFFYKDIQTAQVVFDSTAYLQTLDTQVMPYFRAMAYVRKWDPTLLSSQLDPTYLPPLVSGPYGFLGISQQLSPMEEISPDDFLDNYRTEKQNVWYAAGSQLCLKSNTPLKYALIGWYAWPNLDISNGWAKYSSWIANEFPYAIVFDAASAVLQKGGQTDAARKYDNTDPQNPGLVWSHVKALQNSNILGTGR